LTIFEGRVSTTSLLDFAVVVGGFTDGPFAVPLVLPGFDMLKCIMRGRPPASQSAKSSDASRRKVR
jgi:hypothetical protein